jgi:hypothetical protein
MAQSPRSRVGGFISEDFSVHNIAGGVIKEGDEINNEWLRRLRMDQRNLVKVRMP